jgi:hypothetical protein
MNNRRLTRILAGFLGVVFLALGVVETVVRVRDSEYAYALFWFTFLCGGGTLILWGTFRSASPRWAVNLVIVGAILGSYVSAWTVILPLLALTLILLILRDRRRTQPQPGAEPAEG